MSTNTQVITHEFGGKWCMFIIPDERLRHEDQKFKVILSYTLSMRAAWATQTLLQLLTPSK